MSFQVSAENFSKIVDFVASPPGGYDLLNYNCTNFVYDAFLAGGISLPNPYNTVGYNPNGVPVVAMTPAGLGNSIEQLEGKSGVHTNDGTTPNSKGPCK